jgi:hypothetical protein
MKLKISALLVGGTLLGSTTPYTAHAAEQFIVCVKDMIGCRPAYTVTCQELRADPAIQAKAQQICKGERGYSNWGVQQIGTSGPGGECGTYQFVVTCR